MACMQGIRLLLLCMMCSCTGWAFAAPSDTNSASSLRARYVELGPLLTNNQYLRPLYLESADSSSRLRGEVYALVHFPFAIVSEALNDPLNWCDVLILHIYTQKCQMPAVKENRILVDIGKRSYLLFDKVAQFEFSYNPVSTTPDYFDLSLIAKTGPLDTSDYRVLLEAVSVRGETFLHLTYSYAYGFVAKLAMETYLATAGSGKVGFTQTGRRSAGQAENIGGMRGVVERNTMRYYLAVEAYLEAFSSPPQERREKGLQSWFTSTEQFPRQLSEMDRATYLETKR